MGERFMVAAEDIDLRLYLHLTRPGSATSEDGLAAVAAWHARADALGATSTSKANVTLTVHDPHTDEDGPAELVVSGQILGSTA
jgi:hypothetical protein